MWCFGKLLKICFIIIWLSILDGCATYGYPIYGVPANQWNTLSNSERQAIIDSHNVQRRVPSQPVVNQPATVAQQPVIIQQPVVVTQSAPVYYPSARYEYYNSYPYWWWYPSLGIWFDYRYHSHYGHRSHWRSRR